MVVNTEFFACMYFANGGRLKYASENFEDAMERARFWYNLFVLEWKGRFADGAKIVSICVRKPCGTEIELM